VWLLVFTSSGGTTRLTTAQQDVLWDGNTYSAVGGALSLNAPSETGDPSAQGLQMTLSGVSQTIISDLLNNDMRGQDCTLYFGQVLLSTGVVATDPIQTFTGLLNETWQVTEQPGLGTDAGTVTISTAAISDIARYLFARGVRSNVTSHNDMLDRGGLAVGDTFFSRIPGLVGKTVTWGRRTGIPGSGGGITRDQADDDYNGVGRSSNQL
jgi:hypothetical protein